MTDCPFPPGSKIFAYLRDSGHERQELSIAQQESQIRQYAIENNLVITRFYKDEAKRGSGAHIDDRVQLHQMMYAFRHHCPEVGVIVWKFSRFARSQDHSQLYRAEIRSLGKIFHALRDYIPEGPIARVYEAIIEYKDEQYLQDMSTDIQRALRELVVTHRCVPGRPPVGFVREPVTISTHRDGTPRTAARWVPDPGMIPTIRQAFQMRAAGASINAIITATNGSLYPSKNSYRTFFCNKIYIGILEFGEITVPDYCEPIVDRDTWDAVQMRQGYYTRRRHMHSQGAEHPRRANSRYLLSGLAHCARCDSPLSGHTSPQRNGSKSESYICGRSIRNPGQCQRNRIPRVQFENVVLHQVIEQILQPENMHAVYWFAKEHDTTRISELEKKRQETTKRLANTRRQLGNVSKAIAEHGPSQTLFNTLDHHEHRETELLTELSNIDHQILSVVKEVPRDELTRRLRALRHYLSTTEDDNIKRLMLRGIIQKITVQRDGDHLHGEITYYYPPPSLEDLPATEYNGPDPPAVSKSHDPPGAPRYTHSMLYSFIANKTPAL